MPGSMKRQPFNPLARRIEGADLTDSLLEPQAQIVQVEVSAPVATDPHGVTWVGNIGISPIGLMLPDQGISEQEWYDFHEVIRSIKQSWQFILGDWFDYGVEAFPYTYEQIAAMFGYKPSTVETFASVCRNVPRLIRINSLSFGHHRLVSKLQPEVQETVLKVAAEHEFSVQEFREYLGMSTRRLSVRNRHQIRLVDSKEFRRAKNADPEQRRLLAAQLRSMADELEQANG